MVHTYNSTGTDTVMLIVSGPLGANTNTQLGYITVTNIPPLLAVTPASHDFGLLPVGQTSTQTFSVINDGVDTLSGTATVSGAQFALVGGSPYNVSGGQTDSVTVSFDPNSAGSFTGSVVFASNGGVSTNAITGSAAIAPVANFTASPTNGAASLNVTFTDTSTGTITNHSWTFGDGGTSTLSSPSHTYTTSGVFSVTLTVFGPLGSSATNRVHLITVTNAVNTPPTVSIVRPATGMLYPSAFTNQTITIVADASDSDGISTIEFFVDAIKLGQTNANPGAILWNEPTVGPHTLTAVAHDTLGATNTSAPIVVTIGAKNSPLGDWEVTIGGADKGVEFVTFEDDFSASGYDIRLKKFGENDVSGTWGFDAKGRLTGSFIEQLGSATNWTGTLAGSAKSLKSLSASVTTTGVGVFRWKGVPATEFPDLSGTWTGVVTIVKAKAATPVSYAIRTNANDSAVFDVTTTINTNTVIGQLIATSRDVVYGYVAVGGTNITMSGKFKDRSAKALPDIMTFKGAVTNTPAEKVSIQLSREIFR
jgi:PKD repeat protein